jgi:hypothetical protein
MFDQRVLAAATTMSPAREPAVIDRVAAFDAKHGSTPLGAGLAVSEPGLTGRDGVTGMSPKRSRRSSLGVVEAIVDLPATRRSRGIALVADALVG